MPISTRASCSPPASSRTGSCPRPTPSAESWRPGRRASWRYRPRPTSTASARPFASILSGLRENERSRKQHKDQVRAGTLGRKRLLDRFARREPARLGGGEGGERVGVALHQLARGQSRVGGTGPGRIEQGSFELRLARFEPGDVLLGRLGFLAQVAALLARLGGGAAL